MSELISRQVALDALTEYWKGISDRHPTLDGEMAVYADCKGVIKRLPSSQPDLSEYSDKLWRNAYERGKRDALEESQWIPCSDRLPEDSDYHDLWETPDGAVLWCKATGEIGVGWYYESTKNWCDLWDNGVKDVIAWMPLPDLYKGEQR